MKGTVDMTNVQEGGSFELVEEGIHNARITEIKEKKSPNDDPMIAIKLVVMSGSSQDNWLWDNIIISNNPSSPGYKVLGRTKHFLHCIDEPYEDVIAYDTDRWLYKDIKIRVKHEKFIGKDKNEKTSAKVAEYLLDEEEQQQEDMPNI